MSRPLSTGLMKHLLKGTFPLKDSASCLLWRELVNELALDPAGVVAEIKAAQKYADPDFLSTDFSENGVDFQICAGEVHAFLGAAHATLSSDWNTAHLPPLQPLIQDLRGVMEGVGMLGESTVGLSQNLHNRMGNGLVAATLTCLPDGALGTPFGTTPDQFQIGIQAPVWNTLKRRAYETPTGAVSMKKPHYVLAHLLNHNINGSGRDAANVVPFWATANTQMAQQVEKYVKDVVLNGGRAVYTIRLGPEVGMTLGRAAALAACTTADEQAVIQAEAHLCSHFEIECKAYDFASAAWVDILGGTVFINNFVPETVPTLM